MLINRRRLIGGIGLVFAAPVIVRAASLMPVRVIVDKWTVLGFDAAGKPVMEVVDVPIWGGNVETTGFFAGVTKLHFGALEGSLAGVPVGSLSDEHGFVGNQRRAKITIGDNPGTYLPTLDEWHRWKAEPIPEAWDKYGMGLAQIVLGKDDEIFSRPGYCLMEWGSRA